MKLSNTASALLITATATATATLTHAADAPASTPADPTPSSDTVAATTSSPSPSNSNTNTNTNTSFYSSPLSTPAPSPTTPPSLQDDLSSLLFHDNRRRHGAPVVAPAAAGVEGQVSPVTTFQENRIVNGVAQQVQVVYTQLFSAVPDQWDAPRSGSIGLGSIKGEIGIVKTNAKRAMEVQAAAEKRPMERRESMAGKTMEAMSAGSALAMLVAITAMLVV